MALSEYTSRWLSPSVVGRRFGDGKRLLEVQNPTVLALFAIAVLGMHFFHLRLMLLHLDADVSCRTFAIVLKATTALSIIGLAKPFVVCCFKLLIEVRVLICSALPHQSK
jgi:hypothetical protein